MFLHVNPSSGVPIYLQIETQLKNAIASGLLKQGEALLPVRKMAAQLGINPNTVARCYQNLERDGVVRTVTGGGTYVADRIPGLLKSEKIHRLQPYARQVAVEGSHLRLTVEEILQIVKDELTELKEQTGEQN